MAHKRFLAQKKKHSKNSFIRQFTKRNITPTESEKHLFISSFNQGWNSCIKMLNKKKLIRPKEGVE